MVGARAQPQVDTRHLPTAAKEVLRRADVRFSTLLQAGQVLTHAFVVGELALGSLANRVRFLRLLDDLRKKLHDNGILVQGCFAFGSDGEDASVFEQTVEMIQKVKIDLPRYSILTPFPRTKLYAQLESEGRIVERDWAMYDVEHCVFIPAKMTKEELEKGITWAWKETYKASAIAERLAHRQNHLWLSFPTNLGYRGYAKKYERFNRDVMCDNSDIPILL